MHRYVVLFLFFTLAFSTMKAQDSAYIRRFQKSNDVETNLNWQSTQFNFNPARGRSDGRFLSNNAAYAGCYLDYKWLSIGYSIKIPGTALDRLSRQVFAENFHASIFRNSLGWQGYYNLDHGLLLPSRRTYKETPVNYKEAGSKFYYLFNSKHFSYNSSQHFYQNQLQSAGSLMLILEPSYHHFSASANDQDIQNNKVKAFLLSSPSWLTTLLSTGYIYHLVWEQGKWNLSPRAEIGFGASRLLQKQASLEPTFHVSAGLTAGYSTSHLYVYLTGSYDQTDSRIFPKNFQTRTDNLSLTFGYRLGNLKKKVLGIL